MKLDEGEDSSLGTMATRYYIYMYCTYYVRIIGEAKC